MKKQKLYVAGFLLLLLIWTSGCKPAKEVDAPLSLTWEMGEIHPEEGTYENSFILKNLSDAPVGKDWVIYYAQLPHHIQQETSPKVKVEWISGTYHKIYPTAEFTSLAPGAPSR